MEIARTLEDMVNAKTDQECDDSARAAAKSIRSELEERREQGLSWRTCSPPTLRRPSVISSTRRRTRALSRTAGERRSRRDHRYRGDPLARQSLQSAYEALDCHLPSGYRRGPRHLPPESILDIARLKKGGGGGGGGEKKKKKKKKFRPRMTATWSRRPSPTSRAACQRPVACEIIR